MATGKYRNRITIERDTGTAVDGYNDPTPDWGDYFVEIPAEIDTGGTRKFYTSQQVHSELTHLVTIPYIAGLDITAQLRIVWGSRTLNSLGPPIDVKSLRREYEIRCVEDV